MAATAEKSGQALALEGTFLGIDSSSWTAWLSYFIGFQLGAVLNPVAASEIAAGRGGAMIMIVAVVAFFALIIPIQRFMDFSLKSNTYGVPVKLVTGGVFQYSRNPIYVAFLVPLLSISQMSWIATAAAVAIYILAMNRWVISREERVLEEKFGDDYRAYKASVRRWV